MKTKRRVGLAVAAAAVLLVLGHVAAAQAAAPTLEITRSATPTEREGVSGTRHVSFEGTTSDPSDPITLTVDGSGPPIVQVVSPSGGVWSAGPVPLSADGHYSAVAEQSQEGSVGSMETTFEVNTKVPTVKIFPPTINAESVEFSGQAGDDPGDSANVILKVYEGGASESEPPLQEVSGVRAGEVWRSGLLKLPPGGYYVRRNPGRPSRRARRQHPNVHDRKRRPARDPVDARICVGGWHPRFLERDASVHGRSGFGNQCGGP